MHHTTVPSPINLKAGLSSPHIQLSQWEMFLALLKLQYTISTHSPVWPLLQFMSVIQRHLLFLQDLRRSVIPVQPGNDNTATLQSVCFSALPCSIPSPVLFQSYKTKCLQRSKGFEISRLSSAEHSCLCADCLPPSSKLYGLH